MSLGDRVPGRVPGQVQILDDADPALLFSVTSLGILRLSRPPCPNPRLMRGNAGLG